MVSNQSDCRTDSGTKEDGEMGKESGSELFIQELVVVS